MDGGEEAGAQVVVQILVLAHFKHLLPFLLRHPTLDAFSRLFFVAQLLPAELHRIIQLWDVWSIACSVCASWEGSHSWVGRCDAAGQKSQSVRQLPDPQSLQPPQALRLIALAPSAHTRTGFCSQA